MGTTKIKVLFFDVGGVLLNNGWGHQSRQEAARLFDLNYEEMDVLHDFIFNIYEIGKITLDDYLDTVVFNHPRSFSKEDFKSFMFAQSEELPGFLQWLKDWKRSCGFRIISINNEGRELNNHRIQKFGLHDCFDAFVSSCEVGMRKPDPGIFKLAMGIAQVNPDECIYFDDRIMLAQAAQKLGIRAIHHQDFLSTKKILEAVKSQ
ncbi:MULTISPECIES: HAD family hydrolase [Pedobacter]|uniref:HAD-superfamily hydrolase, subfamily IA, variant 3 n=1 Tax=Pedobacter heparinus (strain ATCC 13125 / DSM 2366 / CIP 104194 / JCM 7457 / NBRC 12017 / NCIMB 9290 / NRRL B-14731 / HIM 762-3) TaxID=485917 RepID=C6XSV7_PEDHD|nr:MULTISPECIES: HAD family phosphatase [Pedobacter]ACU05670.1 HAD-superfamily hydrolase, subfamily IA, variant 3 [Pedobacter heparinus DSM 2366]MBB5440836.1 putative hydrolase of the HAD superfamily [Pedobacter sp. AK017]